MASRVFGLSLRRLSDDMPVLHGYTVLVTESFVDPSRFSGACYRASNWNALDPARGYSRRTGGPSGSPARDSRRRYSRANCSRARPPSCAARMRCRSGRSKGPPNHGRPMTRGVFAPFSRPFRISARRGRRFELHCYLTIALAARLAGYRGVTAFAEFGERLSEEQKAVAGAFWNASRQCYAIHAEASIRYIFSNLPPDALDRALRDWAAHCARDGCRPVALDGKDVRCAWKQTETGRRMMVAAVEHGRASCSGKRKSLNRRTNFQPFETWRRTSDCRDAPQPSTPCAPGRKPREAWSRIAAPDCLLTAIKGN